MYVYIHSRQEFSAIFLINSGKKWCKYSRQIIDTIKLNRKCLKKQTHAHCKPVIVFLLSSNIEWSRSIFSLIQNLFCKVSHFTSNLPWKYTDIACNSFSRTSYWYNCIFYPEEIYQKKYYITEINIS